MGIAGTGSGCWEAAREVISVPLGREGVATRAGMGLGALFNALGAIAGDWLRISGLLYVQ